jgi:hypothetical protein
MSRKALVSRTVMTLIEPAIRSRADRLYLLATGRPGSKKRAPSITNYYETGLVVSLYEFLLMSPDLAHLEISHEVKYEKKTRPEQVDLWIKPVNGGHPTLIECGDFTPGKVKADAKKMRRLNPNGTNWFLAFFRDDETAKDPWSKLKYCRGRKDSLKGKQLGLEQRFTGSFSITLPKETIHFGWSMIRIK